MKTPEITQVCEEEVGKSQRMAEIRFDCYVSMFEMMSMKTSTGFLGKQERSLKPQWFKLQGKLTLEVIKSGSEYEIGRLLKQMLAQLENHIKRFSEEGE